MPNPLQQAVAWHQKGNFAEAEHCYGQALLAEPTNFMAHHLFGMLRYQQGQLGDAIARFDRAIALKHAHTPAHHGRGTALYGLQRFAEALSSFDTAIALDPRHLDALIGRANALRELGRLEEALAGIDRAFAVQPHYAELAYNRGIILVALRRFSDAIAAFDVAISLKPEYTDAWLNRGSALHREGRYEDAVESFERVSMLAPKLAAAPYNRGVALKALRRYDQALASFEAAVGLAPRYVQALIGRGEILRELGRYDEALAAFDEALELAQSIPELSYNRGVVLLLLRREDEAVAAFDRAIALKPDYADAWADRASALRRLRRFPEAFAAFDRALALAPGHLGALNNRGNLLWDLGRIDEAKASFDQALAVDPTYVRALRNRGSMLWAKKRALEPALVDLEKVLALAPDDPFTAGEVLYLKLYAGDWRGFDEAVATIDAGVRAGKSVVQPFQYQVFSGSPADLRSCATIYAAANFPPARTVCRQTRRRPGRVRLGYLCGEFREHATSHLSVGVYEHHDRTAFEVIAFDNGYDDRSPMRRRLAEGFDQLVDISGMSDAAAAALIADLGVDILVNLNGYYGGQRMGVFAERPVPVQVNFLGFPGTLGATYIDYIVADPVVIPEDEKPHYTEQIVYLPVSYQPNDGKRGFPSVAATRPAHNLPEQAFVFCHFNHGFKILPTMFDVWMRILRDTPASVLWLLQTTGPFADNLRREARMRGIAPDRLIFAPVIEREQHLARLPLGDLFLDLLPCNAHTTASDALWMGLPLLTCRGTSFAGRVAPSLLEAIGMPELIAETFDDYEKLATALPQDPARLAAMRQKLTINRTTTSLFDTARYTRHLEAAYREMVTRWEKGERPRGFTVTP